MGGERIMDEKTAKIKAIPIDERYTQTVLQFKIDTINTGILELSYILHAVNGDFSSVPICISLEGGKTRLLGCLRYTMHEFNNINREDNYFRIDIDSFGSTNCDIMWFEESDKIDTLGRKLVEFSFMVNGNMDKVMIPIEIFPMFLDTFIKIVEDKDIVEEVKTEEYKKEESDMTLEELKEVEQYSDLGYDEDADPNNYAEVPEDLCL